MGRTKTRTGELGGVIHDKIKTKDIFPTLEIPSSSILRRKYRVLPHLTTPTFFWQTTLVVNNRNENFLKA